MMPINNNKSKRPAPNAPVGDDGIGKRPDKADGIKTFNLKDHADKIDGVTKGNRQIEDRLSMIPDEDRGRWQLTYNDDDGQYLLTNEVDDLLVRIRKQPDADRQRVSKLINGVDYLDYEINTSKSIGATVKMTYNWVELKDSKTIILVDTRLEEVV